MSTMGRKVKVATKSKMSKYEEVEEDSGQSEDEKGEEEVVRGQKTTTTTMNQVRNPLFVVAGHFISNHKPLVVWCSWVPPYVSTCLC